MHHSRRKIPPPKNIWINWIRRSKSIWSFLRSPIYFGRHPENAAQPSLIFFPCLDSVLCCGLSGIVYVNTAHRGKEKFKFPPLEDMVRHIQNHSNEQCQRKNLDLKSFYLGGMKIIDELFATVQFFKNHSPFFLILNDAAIQDRIAEIIKKLRAVVGVESSALLACMGRRSAADVDIMSTRIEKLKDIVWSLDSELTGNIHKIKSLGSNPAIFQDRSAVSILKNINAALNSIDRLEVRGRDSAGISLMFILNTAAFENFSTQLRLAGISDQYQRRLNENILKNNSINFRKITASDSGLNYAIAFTYKISAEIGSLGDNVAYLRQQITNDPVFQSILTIPHIYHTLSAHTRWASVGDINEANCHPVDNQVYGAGDSSITPIIHVCLNGDIDNFQSLKKDYEIAGIRIPEEITTDTKIIPILIESYIQKGHRIEEAFRLAVLNFEGSHAISMHTDLAPGKLFLALKGSGQAIFIGLANGYYMPVSEIYGLVEETTSYIKMDGEALHQDESGISCNGQIFILDQSSSGGLDGIDAKFYDGAPILINQSHIRTTPLTSRDIDRQNFDHYFLKEITESPSSVRRTLENRWKIFDAGEQRYVISLDSLTVPDHLASALVNGKIKRIILIGQGTAGVAALACCGIMRYYLKGTPMQIESMKSSELSGFILDADESANLSDTLLIPISQSGTTTDTNRTVDMAKKRGALSIAIVNRRDSDLTFKVNGVLYTSSGRDIEMSVASTKAFYSQIIAGAILGLYMAQQTNARNGAFISNEIKEMLELPAHMEKVLALSPQIKASADRHAVTRTYWAAVGSGPNKAAADEIRIKLSELCYKTISSDFIEDKKHIDLSSEPLIFVCAAGTRRTVINDIVKDTAIFRSHKALPIVIADENEDRFDPYAEEVIHVPTVSEHFAPILNTLVGHLWGYHAALSINYGSRFLFDFRKDVQETIAQYTKKDLDMNEIALEKSFREKIFHFYMEFRKRQKENMLSSAMGINSATNLTLLLKYLAGKLPLSDFVMDFGVKGTARNMFNKLFELLGESINNLARPVDAIKHQAKTVTVGTSRIEEKVEGIIFNLLAENGFNISQLTINNVMVIKNLQGILSAINGTTLYRISGINLLGEPTDETTIEVIRKTGTSAALKSRAEKDRSLKGTKKIIVQRGNVYIGMGRKDNRSILVIPIISTDPSRPNIIEYLILIDIQFNQQVSIPAKIKALGGKYEHIKNLVLEYHQTWDDAYLERVKMRELFGLSAEKISESIVSTLS
jgi:glutamine---fructose-6-phosphate transaminase (isomerizing)